MRKSAPPQRSLRSTAAVRGASVTVNGEIAASGTETASETGSAAPQGEAAGPRAGEGRGQPAQPVEGALPTSALSPSRAASMEPLLPHTDPTGPTEGLAYMTREGMH